MKRRFYQRPYIMAFNIKCKKRQVVKTIVLLTSVMLLQVAFLNVLKAQSNIYAPDVKMSATHNTHCGTNPTNAQDNIMDMIQTSDGYYVGVGFSWIGGDQPGQCYDMSSNNCIQNFPRTPYVVKMNASGTVIAEFKYNTSCPGSSGTSSGGVFWGVVESSDGYAITGEGPGGLFIVKIAKNLSGITSFGLGPNTGSYCMKRVWKVTYPNNPTTGVLVPDGYIAAGIAYTGTNYTYHDTYIIRLAEDMSWIWSKTIHLDHWSKAYSVTPLYEFGTKIDGTPNPDPNGQGTSDYGTNNIVTGFAIAGEYVNSDQWGGPSEALAINISNNSTRDIVWTDIIQSGAGTFSSTNGPSYSSYTSYNRLPMYTINCVDQTYDNDPNDDLLSNIYQNITDYGQADLNSSGNVDIGKSIIQTTEGDIVMAAEFHLFALSCNTNACYGTEYKDAETVLLRMKNNNNIYPAGYINDAREVAHSNGPDFEEKVKETADGGFIVASTSSDIGNQPNNPGPYGTPPTPLPDILADRSDQSEMALFKVDHDLKPQWTFPIPSNYYFNSGEVGLYSFAFTSDGGYIVAGFNTNNNEDVAVAKLLNCQGTVTANYTFPQSNSGAADIIKDANETDPNSPYYDANYRNLVAQGKPAIVQGTWNVKNNITLENYTLYFMDTKATTYPQSTSNPGNPTGITVAVEFLQNINNYVGGHLVLQNCTLRGLDAQGMTGDCASDPGNLNDMWDGITVYGTSFASQFNNPERMGWLELYSTTIREARTGVSLGPLPDASNTGSAGYVDGGGILQSSGSQFINCRIGALFYPYSDPFNPGYYGNLSWFGQTTFDCTGPLKGYNGRGINEHVEENGVIGIPFTACTFQNSGAGYPCDQRGTGIHTFASPVAINVPTGGPLTNTCPPAGIDINNANIFRNLDYGVYFDNGDPSNANLTAFYLGQFYNVKHCITAINNPGGATGSLNDPTFMFNYFNYGNGLASNALGYSTSTSCDPGQYTGITIQNCRSFNVSHNRLHITHPIMNSYDVIAISISGSGISSAFPSKILFNEFRNESPAVGVPFSTASPGAYSTGILITDPSLDAPVSKFIDIYGNGSDYSNPGHPNPNLNNYLDWNILDPGFSATSTHAGFGVDNYFTSTSPTHSYDIYSYGSFTYKYYHPNSPAFNLNTTNSLCHNVTNTSAASDYDAPTNLWYEYQYCLDPGSVMPMRPEVLETQDTGSNGVNPEVSLKILPNPFSGSAVIRYHIPGNSGSELQIMDAMGRRVQTILLKYETQDLTLNAETLKPGLYYYSVMCGNRQSLNGKFMVANP